MSAGLRLLSLSARLPGALLPFAAALGLADAEFLVALLAAAAALVGYWCADWLTPAVLKRVQTKNLLLCTTVAFVVVMVLLIVAAEQHVLWAALLLSGLGGLSAPAERHAAPNSRLDRTAVGAGFLLAVICGAATAWTLPLVAAAFLAAAAVPVLVMIRTQPPRNSATARL